VVFASCSTVDTDFTGKLVDVHPDGQALAVCDGILRARYHESLERPQLLDPWRICRFVVCLGATANVFRAGHRIRLEVSSSNFPRYDPNPNTGGPSIALEAQRPVTARLSILHSREHPSQLILPAIPWPG
jgi:putative CocE/NonD family hydrolase